MEHLNDVILYQQSTREGALTAPFTPEHAVYDTEGVRLDVKLKGLDISRIKALLALFESGGIRTVINVDYDEDKFISAVVEHMNVLNKLSDTEKLNSYLAILNVQKNNFMDIDVTDNSYTMCTVNLTDGGEYDVRFEVGLNSYQYHFNVTSGSSGSTTSYLYFVKYNLN